MALGFLWPHQPQSYGFLSTEAAAREQMMRLKARLVYQWQPHCGQTPGQTGQRAEEGHGKSGMAWG